MVSFGHARWSLLPDIQENTLRYELARAVLMLLSTRHSMLWTLVLVLLVLWALGLATSYTLGGLLHILLIVAVIGAVVQLLQGRRVV